MNITVLGAGAWGTALAKLLRESLNVSNAGCPGAGLVKLATLKITGFVPMRPDWSTKLSIHAPPLLLSRLK